MKPLRLSLAFAAAGAVLALAGACDGGDAAAPASPDAGVTGARPQPSYEEPETGAGPVCVPKQDGPAERAAVPAPYAGMTSPLLDDVAGGAIVYRDQCLRCHGEDGVPSGGELHPAPPDFTRKSFAADYMFWRVTKGGTGDPICSDMPSFENLLTAETRWRAVAYLRSIGPRAADAGGDASPE